MKDTLAVIFTRNANLLDRLRPPCLLASLVIRVFATVILTVLVLSSCHMPGVARVPDPMTAGTNPDLALLEEVELNGTLQSIQIRTQSPKAPILLYLAGGPSGSEMAWLRHFHPELEKYFIVVHWDQRGAAKSYAAADWQSNTPDTFIEDAGVLIDLLSTRFDRDSLVLVGNSWGSILGVNVAVRWPEKLDAYVGVTQQVNVHETDQLGWKRTLARARAASNDKDVKRLEAQGPPPYSEEHFTDFYFKLIRLQDKYGGTVISRSAGSDQMSVALGAPEYSWWDRINFFRGMIKGWTHVYSQLLDLDIERDVPALAMHVFLFLSHDDITVPPEPAVRWLEGLQAPHKQVIWFDDAGHTLTIDARAQFDDALVNQVLPMVLADSPVSDRIIRLPDSPLSQKTTNAPAADPGSKVEHP